MKSRFPCQFNKYVIKSCDTLFQLFHNKDYLGFPLILDGYTIKQRSGYEYRIYTNGKRKNLFCRIEYAYSSERGVHVYRVFCTDENLCRISKIKEMLLVVCAEKKREHKELVEYEDEYKKALMSI